MSEQIHRVGDRVAAPARTPPRRGRIVAAEQTPVESLTDSISIGGDWIYRVRWDDGTTDGGYFGHGLDAEPPT